MSQVAPQTLDIVGREIGGELNDARMALEAFVEQPDNVGLLERCAGELHRVQGVLRVLEIYGAALLAEEMVHVTRYLVETAADRRNQAESLDALLRAMVQLPSYLERVLAGGRDLALVLLPLLNDLRAVRGSPLLSEGTLLLLNLKSEEVPAPPPAAPGEPQLTVVQWARRLRSQLQIGLVGWIRGERVEANLDALGRVAQRMQDVSTQQPVFQLWWVAGAVIEALRDGGLEGSVSVKRLLGLADRELKRLYEQGEARYCQEPPVELLNNMLYYVARATSSGPRVTAVRASFRLDELLPVDQAVDEERESLSAPSIKLMQTVAAAIREDLGRVKDTLDIFARRGGAQPGELAPQLDLLRKIGDTLGVLGLGELRAGIQSELGRLGDIVEGRLEVTVPLMVEIATTLIGVEDRLDGSLLRMIVPSARSQGATGATTAEDGSALSEEFMHVQAAVLRECIVNLARIKETISQNVGGTLDAAGLDAWPELMQGIRAGLLLLGRDRAASVVDGIAACLRRVMQPGGNRLGASYLDRLADAIVSVEYYMETLQAGRAEPGYMIDNAQACLDTLLAAPDTVAPTVAPLAAAIVPESFAKTVRIDPRFPPVLSPAGAVPDWNRPSGDQAEEVPALPEPPVLAAAAAATTSVLDDTGRRRAIGLVPSDDVDPELIAVFIEEAREEVARIARFFPDWDRDPVNLESLRTVRRSFHTLKGSGRMVGAKDLAEFAWSIENLLNRLLEGTLERTSAVAGTLREAVVTAPELVEHLAGGPEVGVDVPALVARAHALAAGQPESYLAEARIPPAAAQAAVPAEEPPVLVAAEPATIPTLEAFAAAVDAAPPPPAAPESVPEPEPEPAASTGSEPSIVAGLPIVSEATFSAEALASFAAPDAIDTPMPAEAPELAPAPPVVDEAIEAGADGALTESTPVAADEVAPFAAGTADAVAEEAAQEAAQEAAEDSALREIYLRETDAHVAVVEQFVAEEAPRPAPHRLTEAVYRACHTLSGSSKMAEARHGIRLAEPVDRWLRKLWAAGIGLEDGELGLLDDCMRAMQQVARNQDETTLFFMNHDVLRTRIVAAEADADRRIALASAPSHEPAATGVVAELSESQEFDAEIAAIFTDEATELLESAETALQGWVANRSDTAAIGALKRPLHTLKGGARMAGVRSMGDLSHELETAIGQIEHGAIAPDEAVAGTLQAGLDELSRMRDRLAEGRNPPQALALLERLRNLGVATSAGPGATVDREAADGATEASAGTPVPEPISAPPFVADEDSAAVGAAPHAVAGDIVDRGDGVNDGDENDGAVGEHYEEAGIEVDTTGVIERIEFPSRLESEPAGPAGENAAVAETTGVESTLPPMLAVPPGREPVVLGDRPEMARVDAELLDQLLNNAGEVSIGRARLEQQVGSIDHNLGELSRTVTRLKEQLRKLEIETEKQILHRYENESSYRGDFDPLELDRYSSIQQFSRALAETASDVGSIQQMLEGLAQETQTLLQQQARVVTELQNGLMRTRMVPFQRHVQRLSRIVRQAAADTGRQAELVIEGASGELDRQVLERMLPPFEHILRNAVVHGIESPAERVARGKSESGRITMLLHREGSEVIVEVTDDGRGMDIAAIRAKGLLLGLIKPDQAISDSDVMQLVLEPGFTTADRLSQHAGRGVGMDVVATEVKKLGGALHMESRSGEGTRFLIRLPFTLAISHALVVRVEDELYALPLPTVEGVVRLPRDEVEQHLASESASFEYSGQKYRLQQLGVFVGLTPGLLPSQDVTIPVVLVRAGDHSTGLVTDELIGSREIVVKSVGPQISAIRGVSGATILGDGRIVIILDIGTLLRAEWRSRVPPIALRDKTDAQPVALVVDDSITVRRVTQRLLERNGMRVLTARDGLDAIAVLAENLPDVILLDIEMPRMDGYEVAAQVRNDPRTAGIPIIMITSRVGDKHRARAIELGVDDYLGKPYQEAQLLEAIEPLVARRRAQLAHSAAGGTH
jgi:chemosensory pili system protein ChpA (sensor histidine kinase/response regulator)